MNDQKCCEKCHDRLGGNPDLGYTPMCSMHGDCPCHQRTGVAQPQSTSDWEKEFKKDFGFIFRWIAEQCKEEIINSVPMENLGGAILDRIRSLLLSTEKDALEELAKAFKETREYRSTGYNGLKDAFNDVLTSLLSSLTK